MSMTYSSQFNLNNLRQRFFIKKEMVDTAVDQTLNAGAEEIAEKAKSNAPVDTHNLEEAIHVEKGFSKAGNIRYTVVCDGEGSEGRDVAEYASIMENELQPYGNGNYNLGPLSQAKADGGNDVGGKFMERAVEQKKAEVVASVKSAVRKATKGV